MESDVEVVHTRAPSRCYDKEYHGEILEPPRSKEASTGSGLRNVTPLAIFVCFAAGRTFLNRCFFVSAKKSRNVLSAALGNTLTALDLSLCSLHASGGFDCTGTAVTAKRAPSPALARFAPIRISCMPIAWSAYGRPHRHDDRSALSLSPNTSRRRNVASEAVVYQRLHFNITLEIWRCTAHQVCSCGPVADSSECEGRLSLGCEPHPLFAVATRAFCGAWLARAQMCSDSSTHGGCAHQLSR